jgi:hypothetical protein
MHSEDLADHEKLKTLMDTRRAESQSDVERSGIDMFMNFEEEHRKSIDLGPWIAWLITRGGAGTIWTLSKP